MYLDSDDANYENFSSGVTKRRRAQAESLAPKPTVDVVVGQPSNVIKDPKINPDMPKEPPKQVVNKEKSPVKAVASAVILQKSPSKGGKLDVDNFVPGLKNYVKSAILPPFHKNPCSFFRYRRN